MLRAWSDAPAFVVSCPVPLRRNQAALTPASTLSLPQTMLGAEAQMRGFLAGNPEVAARALFCPLPEMFFTQASLAGLRAQYAREVGPGELPVHLRFGGVRSVRVMKEAANGVVLAEDHANPPITASRHPFASGLVLPAGIRRIFALLPELRLPRGLVRAELPAVVAPLGLVGADLPDWSGVVAEPPEFVSFADFRSANFAAGPVRSAAPVQARAARAQNFVLLPWNLEHPGSAVPALVERVARLRAAEQAALRLVVYPFNYPGQTGLIRRLIRRAREAGLGTEVLQTTYVARAASDAAMAGLRRIAPVAWVDGNDPEWRWSFARLQACGFTPVLLARNEEDAAQAERHVLADEMLMWEAESRFGQLHYALSLPSLRAMRHLLEITQGASPPRAVSGRRRQVKVAQ